MKIIVIGAGPGGLAAAMMLQSKGHDVHVYEKQPFVGGRNAKFQLGDFTFDTGPTFLSMIHIAEELFTFAGKNLYDYIDVIELKEMYRLIFQDNQLDMIRDRDEMYKRLEAFAPGEGEGYLRFMKDTKRKMDRLTPILQSKMDRFHHYLRPKVIKALPQLSLNKSLYDVLSDYFSNESVKYAFTFQSKYLGMSPWECPGAFSILSFMEHDTGVFHPKGGVNQLSEAMAKAALEAGAEIHLSAGVEKLLTEGRKVKGIRLESGEEIQADEVVVNGDFAHVMTKLVEPGLLKKYSEKKLKKKKFSCSTFMLYLGLDTIYDEPHHTIVFSDDYARFVKGITKTYELPDDPSIYIQNASVTDDSLAPKGKSALYVLAPVANNQSGIDWEAHQDEFRELVLDTLERKTGFQNVRQHIEVERMITPKQWEEDLYVYEGATFNLGHQLTQMMVLRPHNEFDELKHCWLVGGGTHPGSGLPTILESARITTNAILKKEKHSHKTMPHQEKGSAS
ncbi:phytoene desaturase family protein [Bacillus safensis]|uniref:phytoene desaturase family protein n=1 Tax=Bacillus safensis TaxID=561879 RepID=UPI002E2B778F|nr:phytoene desaturase family protein [Bacillus safensis]MED5223341.1 phytoene desaturase family protein [Bacillus safensis]